MITLKVHSSLEVVGFLFAVTAKLAQSGISVNVVSAYFHDHRFVPTGRADEAMKVLNDVALRAT
ncbi:ACT domain-containing protein [Novipirellula galeiformis]|uniref:ACT domain-containing protein n=1 Tax=Novipirellula galeiformis TaxID=2528004 RepID=UPI001E59F78B|nr:ACT domain-containing protein [Novipirellula galeiformis]